MSTLAGLDRRRGGVVGLSPTQQKHFLLKEQRKCMLMKEKSEANTFLLVFLFNYKARI